MSGRTYTLEQPGEGERLRIRCDDPSGCRSLWAVDEALRMQIVSHWRVRCGDLAAWVEEVVAASEDVRELVRWRLLGLASGALVGTVLRRDEGGVWVAEPPPDGVG